MAHLEVPGADPGVDVGSEEVLLPGELAVPVHRCRARAAASFENNAGNFEPNRLVSFSADF